MNMRPLGNATPVTATTHDETNKVVIKEISFTMFMSNHFEFLCQQQIAQYTN